ncbi:hypothetical protein FisN_15Lh276 [Fistulifera solaris]|uniref:Uncharacterized protein n=1 Tax=Fistulifera solaris TaxID=1519565 RepID=A0A1Z5K1S5_FISSO|nr:hypothetical protein FisN_15Lh276 [Fistulifera solaris]|eukprot:GAX20243.1 hypothetical protein FisN_15Lh276 [Fistulifera solaris]
MSSILPLLIVLVLFRLDSIQSLSLPFVMKQAGKTVFRPGGQRAHEALHRWVRADELVTFSPSNDTMPKTFHSTILLEAILTHQPNKDEIIQSLNTNQILLHDVVVLTPSDTMMQHDLTEALGIGFYALTTEEWKLLVERNGYHVVHCQQGSLANPNFQRLVQEEGWRRTFRIVWNLLLHPAWRQRVKTAQSTMKRYHESLGYILLYAVKNRQ